MPDLFEISTKLVLALKDKNMLIATAESCTGGLMSKSITDIDGSSSVFGYGFVTYANEAKYDLLGVSLSVIEAQGAVCEHVAKSMAEGAVNRASADIGISCTGVAGPTGGTAEKPVGLVYIGICEAGKDPQAFKHNFEGDRNAVREQTVAAAFQHVLDYI